MNLETKRDALVEKKKKVSSFLRNHCPLPSSPNRIKTIV